MVDTKAVKRSVLRVLGLTIVTSGLYLFYWFYVTKGRLKSELKTDDNVGLQTVGLIVPILNAFILYWLYRDINQARSGKQLETFPAGWYVAIPYILIAAAMVVGFGAFVSLLGGIGAALDNDATSSGLLGGGAIGGLLLFLLLALAAGVSQYVFLGLAVKKLNEYWDKVGGTEAPFGKGEIAVIIVGVLLLVLNVTSDRNTTNDDYDLDTLPGGNDEQSVTDIQRIYDGVKDGMTMDEVSDVAGSDPDNKTESDIGGTRTAVWNYYAGSDFVSITFTNGKVSSKTKF